ncbi:LacI family transcriptional regulator [Chitinophaga horti]|uniref:LacI family transcriptional regulator n=1 Tax=Chitinophaga horti TaxID=2920382 RepID=A0ABY6J155_9BACT|nr:LacI family DNA-binding transcriptional regulator [Chitinophaga horti]UYQ93393.1 LacI family transcriptional regulator [Chitinophaga horti]
MKTANITIKDIAKALNLSLSTVSRALKSSYKISEATQQLVKDYAAEHHYRPNLMAQSLKNKNSRCIGVALCAIPNSFYAEVISGIEAVANERDYLVIVTQNFESYGKELKNLENLTWRSIDGLLVSLSAETQDVSHFKKMQEQGLPMVFFDRVPADMQAHKITTDNFGGAFEAVNHLIQNGRRRIAYVTSAPCLSVTRERLEGYKAALEQNGLPVDETYVKYCGHSGMHTEEVEQALDELMCLPAPPDAIFAGSDRITMHACTLLRKRHIPIPEQVALAGFSNFASPELIDPPLTTVKQSAFEMGAAAARLMIELIESKRPVTQFRTMVLPAELCVRDSSAALALL